MLKIIDFNKFFKVHKDALNSALGDIFVQKYHPITFERRKLKDVKKKYPTYEKKMTTTVHCLNI